MKDRNKGIDVLKGIGIILVFVGHTESTPVLLVNTIYLFHMPLFFFISGYLSKTNTTRREVILYKAKNLLYPYYTMCCLAIAYNTIMEYISNGGVNKAKFVKRILAVLVCADIWENRVDYVGVLWFLMCLFMTTTIFELIKTSNVKYFLTSVLIIVGCIYARFMKFRLPFQLDSSLIALVFYSCGYYCKHEWKAILNIIDRGKSVLYCGLGFAIGFVNLYILDANPTSYIHKGYQINRTDICLLSLGDELLFFFSANLICIGLLCFIESWNIFRGFGILRYMGRHSLLMMFFSLYIQQYINRFDITNGNNNWYVHVFVAVSLSILVTWITTRFFQWIYKPPTIMLEIIKKLNQDSRID